MKTIMRLLFTVPCFAAMVSPALSQTVTQIAPLPSQWGYSGSWFLDAQKGFLCGGMKSLYRTVDGGMSWTKAALPGYPDAPIYSVRFFDSNIGIATGNSAEGSRDIFRTTDGGATWSQVPNFPLGGSWSFQDYVSATTGFIGANGALVRTTDAGATWELRSFSPDCPSMTGMTFLDANTGFASGGRPSFESGVFKTTDGGLNWTLVLPDGAGDVISLAPSVLLAVTNTGISRSTDLGKT